MRFQLLPGNAIRSTSSRGLDERVNVSIVRTEHREVIAVVRTGDPGLLELDLDPRRGTPNTELEAVLPPVRARQGHWWRRFGQPGVPGDAGDAAIGAPVTQPDPVQRCPGIGRAAVLARSTGHTSTVRRSSRADGKPISDGSQKGGGNLYQPLSPKSELRVAYPQRQSLGRDAADELATVPRCNVECACVSTWVAASMEG